MRFRYLPFVLVAIGACDHAAPPGAPDTGSGPLPGTGTPAQLTYNPGQDHAPTWLPDGSGILYSSERFDRADHDRCLAELPPLGGQIRGFICHDTPSAADSLDAFESPAVAADGRLALVEATSPVGLGGNAPTRQALLLGSLAQPAGMAVLQWIPYTSPSGKGTEGVSHLAWLADGSLVYVGDRVTYAPVCDVCSALDTLRTGLELMRVSWTGGQPVFESLAGTDGASSVAASGGDTIYFTVNGDARVFRRPLSGGADVVVHDFGVEFARDVAVVGRRLIAVVGGMVYYTVDSTLGPSQRDYGGDLHVVNLASGADSVLGNADPSRSIWFRRPALSPDGRLLVAEGRPYTLIRHVDEAGNLLYTDTIIAPAANLYEYRLP